MIKKKLARYEIDPTRDRIMNERSDGDWVVFTQVYMMKQALLSAEKDGKDLEEVFREYGV